MLDDLHPPARRLAQMRAITTRKKLPDGIADAMASQPELSVELAETLAEPMRKIIALGEAVKIGIDDLTALVAETLAEIEPTENPGADAKAFADRAQARLGAKWQAAGDVDIPMRGAPTAHGYTGIGRSFDGGQGLRAKMVAGLMQRLDPKGEHSPMARDAAQMTIPQMAMTVCRAQGLRPMNEAEAVRMAAHSTTDFPLILESAISNTVARQMGQAMPGLARASHEVTRLDYRAGNSLTLSASGMPQEIGEGGEVKSTTLDEKGEVLPTLRDFGMIFNLTNKALVNDATGVQLLADVSRKMTQGAIERLRAVLIAPLEANGGDGQTMADGQPMFDATHGNVAAEGAALSVTSLSAARSAMRKQRGLQGELLAVEPWALVVPADLETAAQQVLAQIDAAKFEDANPFAGLLELVVEPGLSDPGAWYLVADPARFDGLAHAFLDGQRAPRIETRPGWETLGMQMRLTWALDARFIETATWFRTPAPSGD